MLVVTKLDRLGWSAAHVARVVRDLDESGVTLRTGGRSCSQRPLLDLVEGQARLTAQVRRAYVWVVEARRFHWAIAASRRARAAT